MHFFYISATQLRGIATARVTLSNDSTSRVITTLAPLGFKSHSRPRVLIVKLSKARFHSIIHLGSGY